MLLFKVTLFGKDSLLFVEGVVVVVKVVIVNRSNILMQGRIAYALIIQPTRWQGLMRYAPTDVLQRLQQLQPLQLFFTPPVTSAKTMWS